MRYLAIFSGLLFCHMSGVAQDFENYFSLSDDNISVSASSSWGVSDAENTLNDSGLDAYRMQASRFLSQATFGANIDQINELALTLDYDSWIEEQAAMPYDSMQTNTQEIWDFILQEYLDAGFEEEDIFGPYALHFHYAWWDQAISKEYQLRQKIAYALSQILVISAQSQLGDDAIQLSNYYDILLSNAFGNYKDILREVSLHPTMGFYLTHLNNPRAIPSENIHPDENYAREIMQLFTIGLYELNQDGTYKLDAEGKEIPTYDNDDIKELAKVFTGLGAGALADWVWWLDNPFFGLEYYALDPTVPMKMYENFHEPGQKIILKEHIIPDGQTGMQDIEAAIDILFQHENVGPFLAKRMIQRLVKSNPSPQYISRVAAAFNDNGQGERGDMKTFVKAILLDTEARTCEGISSWEDGRLREPLTRYTHVSRAVALDNPLERYWNNGFSFLNEVKQWPLQAPSVFNFYTHDFQPVGDLAGNGLDAPEFKIHHTTSSVGYLNNVNAWTVWDYMWYSWEGGNIADEVVTLNTESLESVASDVDELLHELDILFTHGQLTDETRNLIRTQVSQIGSGQSWDRTRLAMYLLLISPDYTIMR